MALDPGVTAYCGTVRTGLCNAYLAASVVDSGVVSSTKLGVVGKVRGAIRSKLIFECWPYWVVPDVERCSRSWLMV